MVLDRSSHGQFILSGDGRLLHTNRVGATLAAENGANRPPVRVGMADDARDGRRVGLTGHFCRAA